MGSGRWTSAARTVGGERAQARQVRASIAVRNQSSWREVGRNGASERDVEHGSGHQLRYAVNRRADGGGQGARLAWSSASGREASVVKRGRGLNERTGCRARIRASVVVHKRSSCRRWRAGRARARAWWSASGREVNGRVVERKSGHRLWCTVDRRVDGGEQGGREDERDGASEKTLTARTADDVRDRTRNCTIGSREKVHLIRTVVDRGTAKGYQPAVAFSFFFLTVKKKRERLRHVARATEQETIQVASPQNDQLFLCAST